jgi:hypothetical protein
MNLTTLIYSFSFYWCSVNLGALLVLAPIGGQNKPPVKDPFVVMEKLHPLFTLGNDKFIS